MTRASCLAVCASALLMACATVPVATTGATVPTAAAADGQVEAQIAAFWRWWAPARPRFEAAIRKREAVSATLQTELDARVKAIHPELAWEIGGAEDSGYELTLSPEGNFLLRKLTAAWVEQAPTDHAGWTYLAARRARPDAANVAISYAGRDLALTELRFVWKVDSHRAIVHVEVYHPAFAAMDEDARTGAMFISMDTLLGEDTVEKWVGGLEPLAQPPADGRGAAELLAEVAKLSSDSAKASANGALSVLKSQGDDGRPLLAALDLRLKRLDHLHHDWHLEVVYPYREQSENGLPSKEAHVVGSDLELDLVEALGGDLVYYGHVIHGGQLRVLFYVQRRDQIKPLLDRWIESHPGRGIVAEWQHDPEWKRLAAF